MLVTVGFERSERIERRGMRAGDVARSTPYPNADRYGGNQSRAQQRKRLPLNGLNRFSQTPIEQD